MRKLGVIALVAVLATAVVAGGCGGPSDNNEADPDAGGVVTVDAGIDATVERGTVADFEECKKDIECANENSECKPNPNNNKPLCLRKCAATTDCEFNLVCLTTNQSSYRLAKNHCWPSFCGQNRSFQNGDTGGTCVVGGDVLGIKDSDTREGKCITIIDTLYGVCQEIGKVAPGGACEFSEAPRAGDHCDATSVCIGQRGALKGKCALMCDPRKILSGDAEDCTDAAQDCQDSSEVTTWEPQQPGGAPTVLKGTFGFCTEITACKLFDSANCKTGEGCIANNGVRATGMCHATGVGELAIGTKCAQPGMSTPAAQRCASGSMCFGSAADSLTCQAYCDKNNGTATVDCPTQEASTTCKGLLWDEGDDGMAGTGDDNYTEEWGTCQK